jgi:atypical dual specificity phosphatase
VRASWPLPAASATGRRGLLYNFSYLIDGVLAGSGHPAAFSDAATGLRELVGRGIGALVSLDEEGIPLHHVAEFGLQYLHLPVRDFTAPSIEQACQFVDFVDRQRAQGRPVAVHCRSGYGRTGTMLACYLVSSGMSAADAIAFVRDKRPGSVETREQEQFVRLFEEYWASRSQA